jgi:hypothetical protein
VALVAALLLLAYNANPAQAAGDCSATSGTTTCTYVSTGAEDTFVVPAGVRSVHVVAIGAPGAVGSASGIEQGPAGLGAQVSGDLTVTPGQTLYVEVGGAPTGSDNCFAGVDCIGGFNGGGSSGSFGGGGGGASDVRTVSRDQDGSLGSRLIVAAGGGGSGSSNFCDETVEDRTGGAGGDAGSDGGNGENCVATPGGTGGTAGTQSAGGDGGVGGVPLIQAPSGSLGLGGNGGDEQGGGGGGGYYGGGGGGDRNVSASGVTPAGGGGGGSSLDPDGGSDPTITSDSPSITISYRTGGVGEEPPPTTEQPQTKEECKKGGYTEFGYKNQGQCIKAVNHAS